MNPNRTDRRLNSGAWRRRYRAAFTTLLHLKLTIQALSLPEDPAPEQLSEADLEGFLRRLLHDLDRFVTRETRFLEALGVDLRRWRLGELLPLLDLFDETAGLGTSALPSAVRGPWRELIEHFIRLKAGVVRLHIFVR